MVELSIALVGAAFLAGVLMFLAPCTLPLLPAFLAFISGTTAQSGGLSKQARRQVMRSAIAFVFGFTLVFVAFGILAGVAGFWLGTWRALLSQIGGAFIIILALVMLGLLHVPSLTRNRSLQLPRIFTPGSSLAAGMAGITFALGWTPCVGPILATILLLASTEGSVATGGFLLLIFSLGLAIPFLITAYLYGRSTLHTARLSRLSVWINTFGAVVLLIVGVILLTNTFGLLVAYGYQLFNALGWNGLFEYL